MATEHKTSRKSNAERKLNSLRLLIEKSFTNSPLAELGAIYQGIICGSLEATRFESSLRPQLNATYGSIHATVSLLPQKFGERFWFDSVLVHEIVESWSEVFDLKPYLKICCPSESWGYIPTTVPHSNQRHYPLDLILLPPDADLDSVDLLDYPFLLHELGHMFYRRVSNVAEDLAVVINEFVNKQRKRMIADRGVAKERNEARLNKFCNVWMPHRNDSNWACEIAVDVIGLWSVGPPFLEAFVEQLIETAPDPFLVTAKHPPYFYRVTALIDTAERLGWQSYTSDLNKLLAKWIEDSVDYELSNETRGFFPDEMLAKFVTVALRKCSEHRLPRIEPGSLDQLEAKLGDDVTCYELGTPIVLLAWIADKTMTKDDFELWHKAAVTHLAHKAKRESQ